jgi:hypothetical protein
MMNDASGSGQPWHSVQLFDHAESLSDAVAAFAREGFSRGDGLLVVMKPELWNLTAAKVGRDNLSIADAVTSGQLTVLDSRTTLQRFMRSGLPDSQLFDETVGTLVRALTSRHARLRVYGDMVDVLATEGEFTAAKRLEELWNRLGQQHAFTLFCGYLSPNFCEAGTASALRDICDLHGQVHATPDDTLTSYLLDRLG